MTSLNRQFNRFCQRQSIISVALCFSLLMSTAALAKFRPTPTTPRGRIPPMGTRGCATQTALDFTALAPVSTIAELTLDQPTLAWFVPDREPYPIALKLYQDVAPSESTPKWKLVQEFSLKSAEGIMSFRLPPELLREGQVYAWQAVLMCVPGYPSSNLVAEAQFKVVPMPTDLKQQLGTANNATTKSQLYASAGFWYSALMEALPSKTAQSNLLSDLVEYERTQQAPDSRWAERGRKHSESIAKIVEALGK